MKIPFCTFFYLVLTCNSSAQVVISGKIESKSGQPISLVSITLSNKNSNIIQAYAISDKNGSFRLVWSGQADSVKILASSLGYAKKEMIIPFVSATINFILEQAIIELKEVKAKTPPVWQRKDTINYNASEFKQQQDRVIGDIIARLPGVEVKPNGQILYNGKPINKYYIEGLDLLEDKYGIANNNIPAESVDKIQVLENHQPIRVLDSVYFSDRAALNIKLKNTAKMRLIGRAKLGIGASPFLTEDELTAMLFKKKLQFINTYKYNNTGLDNTRELTSHNIGEYINAIQNGAVKSDLVSLAQPGNPSIAPKRYLFNNAHVASVNQLMPLNATHQLRINASYVNDFQQQQSTRSTRFYLPTDTIFISEQNKFKSNLNHLQTDISLLANTPKYYLKNNLKFQGWWSAERSRLITTTEINQQLTNPFFNLTNDFRLIKTKTNYIQEWGSYVGFVSLPQKLTVLPGLYDDIVNNNLPYDGLMQEASLKTFYTDNYLSLRKRKSRMSAQYKIGFNIQSQNLLTDLLLDEGGIKKSVADTFQNNLHWKRYRIYSENNWSYENNKWRFSFSLPVNYNSINYSDTLLKAKSTENGFFINPSATAMLQISPMWSLSATASYNQGFGDISGISSGYILKTYRNLSNNNAPLAKTEAGNISASVTYRNPLKVVFFSTGIMLSRSKSNLLYSQQFNGNLETLLALRQNNYSNRATISGRLSKYVIDWKTSLGLNYSYGFGDQQQLQQNKLITFSNKNFSVGATISTKLSSKITADYSGTYSTYQSKSQIQSVANKIASANQTFSLNYYATDKLIFRAGAEHYYITNNFSPSANYYFADMSVRYKPKKSKIDYELAAQNLFNTKEFTTVLLMNNIETVSQYQIRSRQAIFKMSFSF
ncbi:hypothetical protein CAP36_16985 [Chitinophagaceae bacterium IBVUCB2]|nr:hypothetical protein CAP36_16985 [Chitinophagaceae bacterium IBVUCB2]